ncbi:MAG: hypothetical protein KY433_11805, partial [Actinobacteria bacterium]|nr:hypothetical protein [Actinomycetota bacterium]
MDVLVLIDKLDDLVHNAKPVPMTGQVRVDKDEIYDILDQMRADYNLDDDCLQTTGNPCLALFVERMGQYATGDFGINFRGRPVSELFLERMPVTIRLTVIALVFETIVGITLGVMAGLRKDKFVDNLVRFSTVLLIAFPVFVFGTLAQVFIGLELGLRLREADWVPS